MLDTNIVLALVRGKALGQYIETTYALSTQPFRPLISIVTRAELYVLAAGNNWGASRREALQKALDNLTQIPIDSQEMVRAYVEVEDANRDHPSGRMNMGKNDIWIAATARVACARLLTTDTDFDHLNSHVIRCDFIDPHSKLPAENG